MSTSLDRSFEDQSLVAASVGGRVIQVIQGSYYVFAGVLSVLVVQAEGRWMHSPFLWVAQVLALAVAGFGVVLIRSGQQRRGWRIGALLSAVVALFVLTFTTASWLAGALPPLFLIDSGLEVMFASWWGMAALYVYFYDTAPVSSP
jgi:hypothetical protein